MITNYTYPINYIYSSNKIGEAKIYYPDKNEVFIKTDKLFTTENSLLFIFFNNKISDMGLRDLGFKISKTDFEDGLVLVSKRAMAMQKACEAEPSTMAAIIGLDDKSVEKVCNSLNEIVVPANYNCPGQLVISGEIDAINKACESLKQEGAKMTVVLPVGGAFHSPLMEPAREELATAIENTTFKDPICPIYQNATSKAVTNAGEIKKNLMAQLTAPVLWTQSIQQMIVDGATEFTEVGPGKVLQGLMRKINRNVTSNVATL